MRIHLLHYDKMILILVQNENL